MDTTNTIIGDSEGHRKLPVLNGTQSRNLMLGPCNLSDLVALEILVEERHHVQFMARPNRKILEQGQSSAAKKYMPLEKQFPSGCWAMVGI